MTSLFQYPKARRDESIVEDHHGTKVSIKKVEKKFGIFLCSIFISIAYVDLI